MKFRRAQAAMEFLMTYGWAILVVLIVIAALAYLGVLNPQSLVPEKCMLQPLSCLGATTDSSGDLALSITNPLGGGIRITQIEFISSSGNIFNASDSAAGNVSYSLSELCKDKGEVTVNGNTVNTCSDGLLLSPGDQAQIKTDSGLIIEGLEGTKARMQIKMEYKDTRSGLIKYADGEIVVRVNGP